MPTIDVLIPTLNAERVLGECLTSIRSQDYPTQLITIIVADGGSRDRTVDIARKFGATIVKNPLQTGESGKAAALRASNAELIALIDSDNILPSQDWMQKMIAPLISEADITGSEPIRFTYRPSDGFITRYCALIGMNDPLCLFLGNYDKESVLTGRWTDIPLREQKRQGYRKIFLTTEGPLPTIGANGTIFRRSMLEPYKNRNYLFDIDIIADLVQKMRVIEFAKVDVGIVHLYCGSSIKTFIRKQRRRVQDYLYHRSRGERNYPWQVSSKKGIILFSISCLTIIPLLIQSGRGFLRVHDPAWFFHPIACITTFIVYGASASIGWIRPAPAKRITWNQIH